MCCGRGLLPFGCFDIGKARAGNANSFCCLALTIDGIAQAIDPSTNANAVFVDV